ncbi:MAG: DUF1822 family protein [Leptolyngbyaceae cyanobacterium HOT.MB2.61]|nr:DUF1822 family protein [Leptolyngbyaceae cyanobacterium HOT.MB2.61]
MLYSTNSTIAIPISPANRQLARQFAEEQPTQAKAMQVYLNTLAVQVVNVYLQMMDIPTNLEASDSWHYGDRLCTDVADLSIPGIGSLECRPIQAGESQCLIPPEVRENRIGYVVVQIDDDHRSGKILGFVPKVEARILPINQLQSLDALLIHLQELSNVKERHFVKLSQWFNNIFETNWQMVEELFANNAPAVVFLGESSQENSNLAAAELSAEIVHLIQTTDDEETRWKAAERLWTIDPGNPASGVRRVMDLGVQLAGKAIALMVAVLRKPNQTVAILLRVYPMGNERYLPPGLRLAGLQNDQFFLETESRDRDDYIQLKFCAESGEQFQVRVSLGNASITESFVV